MPSIRLGFVGLSASGWASVTHGPALLSSTLTPLYSLTAVSTSSAASATTAAESWSKKTGHDIKPYHGSSAAVAADPEIDMVAVAVRVGAHKDAALPVIEAGKSLFVEWPAGKNLRECSELAEAAERQGIRTLVGLQGRYGLAVLKLKEIIASGTLGKILSTNMIALAPRELAFWGPTVQEDHAFTIEEDGGASMTAVAIGHFLGGALYPLLGPLASISATTAIAYPAATVLSSKPSREPTGATLPVTAADQVFFTGTLKSGALASISFRGGYASTPARPQLEWIIDGEEGSVRVRSNGPSGAFLHIVEPEIYLNGEKVPLGDGDGGFSGSIPRMWSAFAKGEEGYATLKDAAEVHKALDAITKSVRDGRRIDL